MNKIKLFSIGFLLFGPVALTHAAVEIDCDGNDELPSALHIVATYDVDPAQEAFLKENISQKIVVFEGGEQRIAATDPLGDSNMYLLEFGVGNDERLNFSAFRHNRSIGLVSDGAALGRNEVGDKIIWNGVYVAQDDSGDHPTTVRRAVKCHSVEVASPNPSSLPSKPVHSRLKLKEAHLDKK